VRPRNRRNFYKPTWPDGRACKSYKPVVPGILCRARLRRLVGATSRTFNVGTRSFARGALFVGGLHNIGEDTVSFFDLDLLPRSHRKAFEAARESLDRACGANARERCRWFFSAPRCARAHPSGPAWPSEKTRDVPQSHRGGTEKTRM